MDPALWIGKTGLTAQDMQLRLISNNLANASTVGFKQDRGVFQDLLYQIDRQPGAKSSQDSQLPTGLQLGTGVRVAGTQKVFSQGGLQVTEQPLDMAINGRGFFEVLMPDGTSAYTRDGQLSINADGQLVTTEGYALQPGISLPSNTLNVTISPDGIVEARIPGSVTPTQVGNIQTVDFTNSAGLQAVGGNLYIATEASGSPQSGTPTANGLGALVQGSLENSNVNVVEELVNMISTQRAYEMNAKVIQTVDQMLGFVTQGL